MVVNLENFKSQRAKIKAKLTRFKTFINTVENQNNLSEIETRMKNVSNLLETFEVVENEIEILSGENYESQTPNFENEFFKVIGQAQSLLNVVRNVSSSNASTRSDSSSINSFRNNTNLGVKLPTIELPVFNGSYNDWLQFHDTFKSLIDENQNLSNIQKLHYLKSCLKDEAANVINSVENTANNYQIAWDLLNERYDNKRIIIQRHVKILFDLPTISKESATSIRSLIDTVQTNMRSLKSLKEKVDDWDTLLIHLIVSKIDRFTHRDWEKTLNGNTMPNLKELIDFLKTKCQVLESTSLENSYKTSNQTSNSSNQNRRQAMNSVQVTCNFCQQAHRTYLCPDFAKLPVNERSKFAKSNRLCFNCLSPGHRNTDCRGKSCKKCDKKHHTLLHFESKSNVLTVLNSNNLDNTNLQVSNLLYSNNDNNVLSSPTVNSTTTTQNLQVFIPSQVLLATAVVDFLAHDGIKKQARVLLDSGAMSNFMTKSFANSLGLKVTNVDISASGLNKLETKIKHSINATVFSKTEQFDTDLEFLIVPSVCDVIPMQYLNKTNLDIPSHIQLADPKFNVPTQIDALIGAELYYDLLTSGQIKINDHNAKLFSTRFGWIIAGKINGINKYKKTNCFLNLDTINNNLQRFWEIEELPETKFLSEEDNFVEKHYKDNTIRNDQGHYIVKLPFNKLKNKLGETFKIAEKRLYALEKRFKRNPELKQQYVEVMREYIKDKHMIEVHPNELKNKKTLFLPHQAVIKTSSLTTKVRVVIDASAPSSSGYSLNNALFKGPNLTPDIFSTLIHFRVPIFAFIADVQKMYLAVYVSDEDSYYQLILWRENETDEIKIFRIIKIIFGEAPSAYLAIKTIFQLAEDEKEKYPVASEMAKKRFYVDNIASGANSIAETIEARDQLIALLADGNFILRQWASNDPQVIDNLPENLILKNDSFVIKTLGINWDTKHDEIIFNVENKIYEIITKRTILSDLMTLIIDSMGLTGPIKTKFKIIMQKLWLLESGWDVQVPKEISKSYIQLKSDLNKVKNIRFPRKCIIDNYKHLQLHGFCDASEKAYGACLYIRSTNESGKVISRLVCSKSRVAPLKTISLARLELCAALLLANLYKVTNDALELKFDKIILWSDSSIVLQWIDTQPYKLKTFVANRISEIRTLTNYSWWRHVPTEHNPADLISRGQTPLEFIKSKLWSEGPEWLIKTNSSWPENKFELTPLPNEEIKNPIALPQKTEMTKTQILHKFSSFEKLTRIIAYVLRYINNLRKTTEKLSGPLRSFEYQISRKKICFLTQREVYSNEIENLNRNKMINKSSDLKALNPFVDYDGLMRVGGRLKYASVLEEKYPIILPKHHITNLLIQETHIKNFHCGVNATLNAIRFKYWPINGRSQVKNILRKCITCCRAKPRENNFIMGNLPASRVTPSDPFIVSGVDYCGPFLIKEKKFRNRNTIKVYVAVFVCFSTKACHLEVVHDLTSENFIAALERFFSRRGVCTDIYSDNGTNFVGANREIKELHQFLKSEKHNELVQSYLASKNIVWHFIPPRSPHMGGLWEAAVKSFKRHLLRSINPSVFTYEEFSTLTIKIEAILNSRPLTHISPDPNDLNPLTPGHFLIGRPITSLPEPSLLHLNENRLSNWQHITFIKQQFWTRWQNEYLQELNVRSKWQQKTTDNLQIGTMVTLREDNIPPLCWIMGRIEEIFPGKDGVIRVVSVRTKNGIYKRNVKNVCILPID